MKEKARVWHYIRYFNIHSIFLRNFLLIACLMVVPVGGMSAAVYVVNGRMVEEEIGAIHKMALMRLRDMIDTTIREIDDFALQIATDEATAQLLADPAPAAAPKYNRIQQLRHKLTPVSRLSGQFIDSVYLYAQASHSVLSSTLGLWDASWFLDNGWIPAYIRHRQAGINHWVTARSASPYIGEPAERRFLTFFYTVPPDRKEREGVILVNVDTDRLGSYIHQVSEPFLEQFFIVDKDGAVLFGRPSSAAAASLHERFAAEGDRPAGWPPLPEGAARSVAAVDSEHYGWSLISVLPLHAYEAKRADLRRLSLFMLAAGLAVALLLAVILAFKVFQPLRKIIAVVENPDRWNDVELERQEPHLNEVRQIAAALIRSHGKRLELEQELRRRLALLRQAQHVALQSQIKPHFLYNTLEAINWNAVRLTGGDNKVSAMIGALSRLLRLSLESPDGLVPIRKELEHARSYVDLLAIRYKNGLTVQWDIDEAVLGCNIPKITLQPLIENAIYHGIKPSGAAGRLRISGKKQDGLIRFEVTDNGVGMSRERTDELNASLNSDLFEPGSRIGIHNVNQRIKLTFGEAYGLTLASEPGQGTSVSLVIPAAE